MIQSLQGCGKHAHEDFSSLPLHIQALTLQKKRGKRRFGDQQSWI